MSVPWIVGRLQPLRFMLCLPPSARPPFGSPTRCPLPSVPSLQNHLSWVESCLPHLETLEPPFVEGSLSLHHRGIVWPKNQLVMGTSDRSAKSAGRSTRSTGLSRNSRCPESLHTRRCKAGQVASGTMPRHGDMRHWRPLNCERPFFCLERLYDNMFCSFVLHVVAVIIDAGSSIETKIKR